MTAHNASKLMFFFSMLVLLSLGFLNIYSFIKKKPQIITVNTTKSDFVFWEEIQKNNPTYRDAYLVLSKLKNDEGDVLSAQSFANEALKVDPFIQSSPR